MLRKLRELLLARKVKGLQAHHVVCKPSPGSWLVIKKSCRRTNFDRYTTARKTRKNAQLRNISGSSKTTT